MKRLAALGMLVLAVPTWAFAHVSVRPRESRPNSEERYTLRVSTEGTGDGAQSQSSSTADPAAIEAWLKSYDAAFNAKDLDKLATFYHSEVTIFEGGGVNRGWADYRDHHLGPELRQFANLQFQHSNPVVRSLGPDSAYVTSDYALKAKIGEREVDAQGLETLVLVREGTAWKIRHSHTSGRPRRPPADPKKL